MSLQERAQKAGFQSAFFTLQYRAVPQIAALYNQACCLNQLVDHETTFLPNEKRSLERQVVAHNHEPTFLPNEKRSLARQVVAHNHETTFLPNEKRSLARQVVAHNHGKYGIGNTCTSTRYCG